MDTDGAAPAGCRIPREGGIGDCDGAGVGKDAAAATVAVGSIARECGIGDCKGTVAADTAATVLCRIARDGGICLLYTSPSPRDS